VKVSSPVSKVSTSVPAHPAIEIVRLNPDWLEHLQKFLEDLRESGDDIFFSPHIVDRDTINRLANSDTKDFYYLLVEDENVLGYGLLRGWDEGYAIPSLGMAIHPSVRGVGFGRLLMNFLHVVALHKGAKNMRLRVLKSNKKAIGLYTSLGYKFEEDKLDAEFLVGFKDIGKHNDDL